ncbi:MAG: polyprenyl synthetase family protein [Proteobacteria bacterium]|nr:polyprenyl synthetase family protein [Pseudomonadota bacterium]
MVQLKLNPQTLKNSSFSQRLQTVAEHVERALDQTLPLPTSRLHEAMRYSVLGGGKRFRSYLIWASSQIFNAPAQEVFKVAAAIELIHSYSLVHDDLPCMDDADMRRNKPSCHKAFGESTAVLVGDALIPLAFQILLSLETSSEIRVELAKKLSEVVGSFGLVAGQMMDLGQEGSRLTLEELTEQQCLKTGVLFGYSMEAGAILGKASQQEQKILQAAGILFGKSFQMIDDWLDEYGDEDKIGKPCRQDTEKLTFLSLLGPRRLYKEAELFLDEALQNLSPFQEKADILREALQCSFYRVK